jgi:hypothetical protein
MTPASGRTAAFEADDVRGRVAQHRLAGPTMHGQRNLVRHRARRQEYRRVLAEQVGAARDQAVHARILVRAFVADLGRGHRRAHRGGRLRLGVAGEVDQVGRRHRGLGILGRRNAHRSPSRATTARAVRHGSTRTARSGLG